MPKSKSKTDALYVVVFGNLNDGWRFATVDTAGDRGEPSDAFGSRPDCLTAAEEANPDLQVRLDQ